MSFFFYHTEKNSRALLGILFLIRYLNLIEFRSVFFCLNRIFEHLNLENWKSVFCLCFDCIGNPSRRRAPPLKVIEIQNVRTTITVWMRIFFMEHSIITYIHMHTKCLVFTTPPRFRSDVHARLVYMHACMYVRLTLRLKEQEHTCLEKYINFVYDFLLKNLMHSMTRV